MEKRAVIFFWIVLFLLSVLAVSAESAEIHAEESSVKLYLFHSKNCPHCREEINFLDGIKDNYPNLDIKLYEVSESDNSALFLRMMKAYGAPTPYGVPATFIGDDYVVGFGTPETTGKLIESKIEKCLEQGCSDPFDRIKGNSSGAGMLLEEGQVFTKLTRGVLHEIEVDDVDKAKGKCGLTVDGEPLWLDVGGNASISGLTIQLIDLGVGSSDNLETQWCRIVLEDTSTLVELPFGLKMDTSGIGLPLFTIIIAGLDGINPCAIWVLCFLLTLMIYAKSRKKMLLIGSIFVLTSGILYFIFMAAWLNFFLIVGYVNLLRIIIGLVAILVGLVNAKDFFFFKKGMSFTIPDKWKPKLFNKMRGLVHESALTATIIGTVVLAFMANTFELVCTFGLPAIYTRTLTLQNLPMATYYSYLLLYNIIYILPLAIIVGVFVATMGAHKFTEKQGRILKLVAGVLMLIMGIVLLFMPQVLTF